MRKTILSLMLAGVAAVGLAGTQQAEARERIYIGLNDVVFSYGRPYWRHNNEPLYVVYERGYPRYYRYDYGPRYTTRYYEPRYRHNWYTRAERWEPRRHYYYDRGYRDYDRRYRHRDRDGVVFYYDWD